MMGLVGAPILIASGIAVMFGVYPQLSAWSALATVLIFAWEASVGIYLVVKGFKPSPITADMR